MNFIFNILKNKVFKLLFIYVIILGTFDFFLGQKIINLLYQYNFLIDPKIQMRLQQENEKKYRVKNEIFHHSFKKNVNVKSQWGPFIYNTCTDDNGFRTNCINNNKFNKNIIIIGDSFTEGIGLDYENTFAGMISSSWKFNIFNMAVSSYSPIIYKVKTKYYIDKGLDAEHVIVFVDISDIDDEFYYYHCENNISVCDSREILDKKKNIKKIRYKFPLTRKFKTFFKIQKRKIFPKNIIYEKEFLRSGWTYLPENLQIQKGIKNSLDNMNELYNYLKGENIPLTVVVYPWPGQLLFDEVNSKQVKIWKKFCENKCKNFINLFPIFFENIEIEGKKNTIDNYYLKNDVHFNDKGHRKIFKALNNYSF